jgi:hypothetical protein
MKLLSVFFYAIDLERVEGDTLTLAMQHASYSGADSFWYFPICFI